MALLSRIPIHHRILSAAVVLMFLGCIGTGLIIWSGLQRFADLSAEFSQLRQANQLLTRIDGTVYTLSSLIHRYFMSPNSALLQDIVDQRDQLIDLVNNKAAANPLLADSAEALTTLAQTFLRGFDDLRDVQASIGSLYEHKIIPPLRDIGEFYATLENKPGALPSGLRRTLRTSRAAYSATLLALNAYDLLIEPSAAQNATRALETIRALIPSMQQAAGNAMERDTVDRLCVAADTVHDALGGLKAKFGERQQLLHDAVDGSQAKLTETTARLTKSLTVAEELTRQHMEDVIKTSPSMLILFALIFIGIATPLSAAVARSVSSPLRDLGEAMHAIIHGHLSQPVQDTEARDEIGEMARSVEIFRHDAIAKRQAEDELRASRDRAESALNELSATQENLLQAEKLAALGSLVAGVAHEVNNPVGISLTVASSLVRRIEAFREDVSGGQLRRSALNDFIAMNAEAAQQLVANLERAGKLIQSFKQVAVDRNQGDRRAFDIALSTEQLIASLKPQLKRFPIQIEAELPTGIFMDSYPGAYGQVLTNLYLNAAVHGFPEGRVGVIRLIIRRMAVGQVEIVFSDTGVGMTEAVQKRVFEPFFTTRRYDGGTGLGLHIVYNIVTQKLGGRISLTSTLGQGTTFRLVLPLAAPQEE